MHADKFRLQDSVFVFVAMFILFNFAIVNDNIAQCDPSTIDPCEIGNNSILQASYHAQIAKTSIGYSITGENFGPNCDSNQTVLTNIPSTTYPMPPDVFPIWGAIGGRTQAIFLGSDGIIYAIGDEDLLIDDSHTTSSAWNASSLSLPNGVTVCDVNKWEGTAKGTGQMDEKDGLLVFSTYSGEVYITGDGAHAIQSLASNSNWTMINMPAGISVVDFAVGYQTLLIQGADGNFYASGPNTYLGDGTLIDVENVTLLSTQPNVSIFGISQIQAGFNSYFVLDGDGTIHVLGENSDGGLGVGNMDDLSIWSKVGAECSEGVLKNVAYISTLSTHDFITSSSAILVNETIRSWGKNNRESITSGDDMIIPCPIEPTGDVQNAVAISNGGHITPFVNTSVQICNIGHNKDGAFGDGNDENGDYGEYICIDIPGMPEICGTKEADLALEKNVSDTNVSTGDDIVFTITVTNNGPESSSGSFVRDQLNPGFYHLSDDSNGAYNSVTGLWIVGPLEVGESKTLNITVKVIAVGTQVNYAQIFADNEVDNNSTPGDNSISQDDDYRVVLFVVLCPIDSSDIFLCSGDSVFIDNNWVHEAGVYLESITVSSVCDSLHTTTVYIVPEPPMPNLQADCEEGTYILSIDPNTVWNPIWDNGDSNHQTEYDGSITEAILTLETDPNCVEQIIIDLPPTADINLIPILEDTTINENTLLTLIAELDTNDWQILWSPESIVDCPTSMSVNIFGSESIEITMYLEHISGCTYESSFFLTVEKEPQDIFVPNIFSPNDDSHNNEWTVFKTSNTLIETCRIYDRWGNLVFHSNEGIPIWDGTVNDIDCNQGVYVYIIRYRGSDNELFFKSGDIMLLR